MKLAYFASENEEREFVANHLAFWGVIARRQFINWARPAGFRKQVPATTPS